MIPNPQLFSLISAILDRTDDEMANARYQDPQLEIRKDGKRPAWCIRPYVTQYREDGEARRRVRLYLGFCDEMTRKQAEREKDIIMAGINAGKFMVQSQIPFQSILQRYRELAIPDLGPETRKTYERHIRLHIEPFFGKMQMRDIKRIAVKTWLVAKEKEGLSHNTLIDLRKVLSAIFSKAKEWNLWDGENPCAKQKCGGKPAAKQKALPSPEGLNRFLSEIRDTRIISAAGARLIAMTAVATGLRVGEVLGLRVKALDGRKETIAVEESYGRGNAKPVKTEDSERVREAPGIVGQLVAFAMGKKPDDYVFAVRGGTPPDDRDLQQHVFRPAAERAGIYVKGFGMHRFRHLNISWRQEAGASPFEAQKSAGHAQPSTTWLYTQTDSERERQHVRAILDRLNDSATPKGPVQ